MPGADAGEEPFEEELVAAADAGFEPPPQAFGSHPWWLIGAVPPGPPDAPLKFAATAAAAAAANAMATAELFCASFTSPTRQEINVQVRGNVELVNYQKRKEVDRKRGRIRMRWPAQIKVGYGPPGREHDEKMSK